MTINRTIDRRTFLRGSGVALALPLLESMVPALARAAVPSPRRMVNICTTLGLYSDSWFPKTSGADYEATDYLRLIDEPTEDTSLTAHGEVSVTGGDVRGKGWPITDIDMAVPRGVPLPPDPVDL